MLARLVLICALAAGPALAADYILLPMNSAPVQGAVNDVRAADLDGDGFPDVVASFYPQGKIAVVRNDGTGHFGGVTDYGFTGAQASTLRDFTGDGKPDVLALSFGGTLGLFPNDGNGALGAPTSYSAGTHPLDVVAADIDADGVLDAVVATDDGEIIVRRGVGGGVFTFIPRVTVAGGRLWGIDAADLDHNGYADVVVADLANGQVRPYMASGGLTLSPGPAVSLGGIPAESLPNDIRLADLDGDGWVDAAVSRLDGNVTVLHNVSGVLQISGTYAVLNARSVDVADLNLDGIPDLVVLSGSPPNVQVLGGTGGMNFAPATSEWTAGNDPQSAVATDFDQDGRPDVLAGNAGSGTIVYLRNAKDPRAECRTRDIDFGTAFRGKPREIDVTLRNIGGQPLAWSATLDGSEFEVANSPGPASLEPGAAALVTVRYTRATEGEASGTLTFTTNDPLSPEVVVTLHGVASPAPVASIEAPTPVTLAVGGQTTASLRLRNLGPGPLLVVLTNLLDLAETSALDAGSTTSPFLRGDASGAMWDVAFDGSLGAGTQGAYNGGMKLTGFPVQAGGVLGIGTRELRVGPIVAGGLSITRKVYLSPGLGYARFVDVAENADTVPHIWSYDLTDNLGFAQVGPIQTSSGDASFTTGDDWVVVAPDDVPGSRAVGRVLRTSNAAGVPSLAQYGQTTVPNSFTRSKYNVTVAPRSRAAIIQWAIQGVDGSDAATKAAALRLSPASAYEHIDAIDRFAAVNVDPAPKIFTFPLNGLSVPPNDSLDVSLTFDAGLASHESQITGVLRATTDDPAHPEFEVPLTLNITGGAIVGIDPVPAPGGPSLALAGFLPNPARMADRVRIAYRLADARPATIALYDVRGRLLARRALEHVQPGPGAITLDGALAPGVVWLRLEQGGNVATTRGVILP